MKLRGMVRMVMEKYASSGILIVSEETIEKFKKEFMVRENKARECMIELSLENPSLKKFLDDVVNTIDDRREEARGYTGGFLAAYTLLKLQSEEYKK